MSLAARVEDSMACREGGDRYRDPHQRRLIHLREELYHHLSSQRIAELISQGRAVASRELDETLGILLRDDAFRSLDAREQANLKSELIDMVLGFGPIEDLLADETVTEIMINGADAVFFERDGRLEESGLHFIDDEQLRMLIDRIVGPLGRRVDEQCPYTSARLPQGHRVNIVIPPLALDGPLITIRKFRTAVFTLAELVDKGTLDGRLAALLRWAVRARKSIAVSGGTGSGKTTLLNALSTEIAPCERIITIEDAAELRFHSHPHVVRLEARPVNAEGSGAVSIRELIINALRMRPDRIIVGECRGAEALDMLQAMNTGHEGSLTTLHANSPIETISRLVMMARWGMDLPIPVIEEQIASALDLIIQLDRFPDGTRRLTHVVACAGGRDGVVLTPVVSWNRRAGTYEWSELPPWIDDLVFLGLASKEEVERWKAACCC